MSTQARTRSVDAVGRITRLRRRQAVPAGAPIDAFQGALALDLGAQMPPAAPVLLHQREHGEQHWEHHHTPGFERWSWRYLQTAVEVVGGTRPATQLLRWSHPAVYRDLARMAHGTARSPNPPANRCPRVASVHVQFVNQEAVEVSARVRYGELNRAVAARFEMLDGRMQCTALELG